MQYFVSWHVTSGIRDDVQSRFRETGAPPPENIKMIGRWHSVTGGGGCLVAETDDHRALMKWTQEWSDVLEFDIEPVLDDEGFAQVIS